MARLSQNVELHEALVAGGGLEACAQLAEDADPECQECAAFGLAFLASNRELQRPLVQLGVLKTLVALMGKQVIAHSLQIPVTPLSRQATPRIYLGSGGALVCVH